VGKIGAPAELLSKPAGLSPLEFKLIQAHARAGYDALKVVGFPWPVAEVALEHHERMDGSGYPQGLKGDEARIESRIMAVADVVEAMCSHRPYRTSLGVEKALAEIERGSGTAYDPAVVDACLKLFRENRFSIQE
jgi:HD-GYP domain-containing protein (c-di-GMP phosphodiesterase class II)